MTDPSSNPPPRLTPQQRITNLVGCSVVLDRTHGIALICDAERDTEARVREECYAILKAEREKEYAERDKLEARVEARVRAEMSRPVTELDLLQGKMREACEAWARCRLRELTCGDRMTASEIEVRSAFAAYDAAVKARKDDAGWEAVRARLSDPTLHAQYWPDGLPMSPSGVIAFLKAAGFGPPERKAT